jgi:hypothetical protein
MYGGEAHPIYRVLEASQTAADARRVLRVLTYAAITGEAYDSEALDEAILRHRRSHQEAATAFAAWARWNAARQAPANSDAGLRAA